jgi:hypothetical protein
MIKRCYLQNETVRKTFHTVAVFANYLYSIVVKHFFLFELLSHLTLQIVILLSVLCSKCGCIFLNIYRVSQEECAKLRESVPYVKVYRYNSKHLYPKLNGYGDNSQRKVGASCGSKYCNPHS